MYLVFREDLEKLARGEIKIEDLTIPENKVLIPFTGEDIKLMLKKRGIRTNLEEVVEEVKKALENCDCGMCIESALDSVVEK
jgi:S-adenosylmethionine synthetase